MSPRLLTGLAAILLVSSAARAGVAEELTAAINKCAAIAEDGARHACYDQLPAVVRSLASTTAAQAPPSNDGMSSSSGGSGLFASQPIPADHITAAVESYTFDYGVFVLTLDNGQVWRQIAATGEFVRLSKDKKDRVTIWRTPFGDRLKIDGLETTYHVKRIK